ncbi:MAG: hypothetical protein IKJ82_03900 [Oscillospiraceae bacterium]|nr:hypothetical protein [Oscillospiraceae bacterium]
MERKIKVVGLELFDYKSNDGSVLKLANLHYTFLDKKVEGIACGRVTISQKLLDRYSVQMNGEYLGAFYRDSNNREKLAALFEEA